MKRLLAVMMLCALLASALPTEGKAANRYIIPDSDSRRLTDAELWEWRYDTLHYILNEIFARHGFPFDPDGRFYPWFMGQTWYRQSEQLTTQECYDRLSGLEWDNVHLVKKHIRERDRNDTRGKTLPNMEPDLLNIPSPFEEYRFTPGQRLPVYSGPGTHYVRGAKGKALTSTNGTVYVGGLENGWVMVLYRTNNGPARLGYADASKIKDTVYSDIPAPVPMRAVITRACPITDDPVSAYTPLAQLNEGDEVTFLLSMFNNRAWAYVEAQTRQGLVRGCVPSENVRLK